MPRARLVIVRDEAVAVIARHRDGRHYAVFPGGGVEAGESPELAAMREAREELGVEVAIRQLLARVTLDNDVTHIFLAEITGGIFGTGPGLEMTGGRPERGTYTPRWLPIAQLLDHPVYPRSIAQLVHTAFSAGWPSHPADLTEPGTSLI